jgi:polyisoprenoid-binding protein YceI
MHRIGTWSRTRAASISPVKSWARNSPGTFGDFTADISFDPDNLPAAKVTADIAIQSLDSKDKERDDTAKGRDFFDADSFPKARFESSEFKKTGENTYEAVGNLTIKDVTLPLSLSFTLVFATDDSGKKNSGNERLRPDRQIKIQAGTRRMGG